MALRYRISLMLPKFEKLMSYASAFGGGIIVVKISEGWGEHFLSIKRGVLYILIIALIINSLALLNLAYLKIEKEVRRVRIVAQFFSRIDKQNGEWMIYDALLRRMRMAKKSIQIVSSQYRFNDTPSRKKYYKGLEEILKEKRYSSYPFIYERIVQVEVPQDRILRRDQVDEETRSHCQQVVEKLSQEAGVSQFTIKQVENVTSAFVIIDDDEVGIFLPWIERDENGQLNKLGYGKAIFLHDHEGELVTQMRVMYQVINNHARLVRDVEHITEGHLLTHI